MFARRQKVGTTTTVLLSVVFGSLMVLTTTVDLFMVPHLSADKPLPFTVRVPAVGIYRDTMTGGADYRLHTLRKARGEVLDPHALRVVRAYEGRRRPPSAGLLIGLGLAFALLLMLYSTTLRLQGGEAAYVRTQIALFGSFWLLALGAKVLLMVTTWSALCIPLVALVVPISALLGRRVGSSTAVVGACAASLLTPIDLQLLVVLLAQALATNLALRGRSWWRMILAGGSGAIAGLICFSAVTLLLQQFVPLSLPGQKLALAHLLDSDFIGAFASPLIGATLAIVLTPALERVLGQLSSARLIALADFESPLLRRLSHEAPGTWAHTLSMANMAEMAAKSIGANGLLVRVGAYYHDLGKVVQSEYFIENQEERNPHDELDPEVSADAIFSHVTEGVKLARKHKIPEPIVRFVYTHHGDSLLEYFWHKTLQRGNPQESAESDFRYPGVPPQTREEAILSLCDAVEAASKTLKPDIKQIHQAVRQILFTKLEQGMLDECGLTVSELRQVINSFVDSLRSSMHVRVKYPWQEEQQKAETPEAEGKTAPPSEPAPGQPDGEPSAGSARSGENKVVVATPIAAALPRDAPRPRVKTRPLRTDQD